MIISPSLLAADFLNLERDIKKINETDCEYLHLDVMDGVFVDDITFGYPLIKSIKEKCNKKLDVHLMVNSPESLCLKLIELKVDKLTIHAEVLNNVDFDKLKLKAKENNVTLGLAFNPDTDVVKYKDYLKEIKFVLIMSVFPGKGGQTFIEEVLENVDIIKDVNQEIVINIDGGINDKTVKKVKDKKIDMLVSGSYIFKGSMQENIDSLR